jgi:hypothetical protein
MAISRDSCAVSGSTIPFVSVKRTPIFVIRDSHDIRAQEEKEEKRSRPFVTTVGQHEP